MYNLEKLNTKLIKREKVLGITGYITNPSIAEIFNREGIDFMLFDLEHGSYNIEGIEHLLKKCRQLDIPNIVRVQDSVYHLISKPIDLGADGILLPRTETVEQVDVAVGALRFAPIGKKGCGGSGLFRKNETFDEFQKNRILLLQIESPLGVQNLPAMLDKHSEQIAGVIIGPSDMSIMCGVPLETKSKVVQDQIVKTIEICKKYGKSSGIFCDSLKDIQLYNSLGMNIFWLLSDSSMINFGVNQILKGMESL